MLSFKRKPVKIIDERQELIDDENDVLLMKQRQRRESVVDKPKKNSKKRKANVVEDDEDLDELEAGNESYALYKDQREAAVQYHLSNIEESGRDKFSGT